LNISVLYFVYGIYTNYGEKSLRGIMLGTNEVKNAVEMQCKVWKRAGWQEINDERDEVS